MKITILCSSISHPINSWLKKWIAENNLEHDLSLIREKDKLTDGDILFLISCHEIIKQEDRDKFKYTLVIHASDLPKGRGWNPHVWDIINGESLITVTLLEAEDAVDSGKIWKKENIHIPKHTLHDEINNTLFDSELRLMTYAVRNFKNINPTKQSQKITPTYHRLRNPEDSRIDPEKSILEQFDLLRVCDPIRFPAFFELHGYTYNLKIKKIKNT